MIVLVYIAPASSNGAGAVWTKLFHAGNGGQWAVDQLLNARGKHSVVIPNIPAGDYLLRGVCPSESNSDSLLIGMIAV